MATELVLILLLLWLIPAIWVVTQPARWRIGSGIDCRVTTDAAVIASNDNAALVTITVCLVNRGDRRILPRKGSNRWPPGPYVFDDDRVKCAHAGTLKVRAIGPQAGTVVSWHDLPPLPALTGTSDGPGWVGEGSALSVDLDQIDYLEDYRDSLGRRGGEPLSLEPNSFHKAAVSLWLPLGTYAVRAYFVAQVDGAGLRLFRSPTELLDVRSVSGSPRRLPPG